VVQLSRMIVNDQRVTLPVIHLAGTIESVGKDPRPKKYRLSRAVDIYLIDDPADPLVLLMVRKGDTVARFAYTGCQCSTDNIKPLARLAGSRL
jgi:hypothetical protein